jgi:hypothetical protein
MKNILFYLLLVLCLCVPALAQSFVSVGLGLEKPLPVFTIDAQQKLPTRQPLSLQFRGVYGDKVAESQTFLNYQLLKYKALSPVVSGGFACVDRQTTRCYPLVGLSAGLPRSQTIYAQWLAPVLEKQNHIAEYRFGYGVHLPLKQGVFSKSGQYFTALRAEWLFARAKNALTQGVTRDDGFRLSLGIGRKL